MTGMPARTFLVRSLALVILATGCDDESPVSPDPGALPVSFRITGEASGTDGSGLTATCSLDLFFELTSEVSRTPERVHYEGTHGGGVERSILARDGSGFAFAADVFGEVEAHLFATGQVEIVIPVNRTAERRFWRSLARFAGTVDASGQGQGFWTCAPFDIESGGYVDDRVVVQGIWHMAPQG
jgi:hypothetical protein